MCRSLLVFICGIYSLFASSQGQQIRITVHGLENSKMIFANYYGDKQFVKDSLQFNGQGEVTIHADTLLPGGVYLAVFPKLGNKYFEFIIAEKQFSIETDADDLAGHMKITGSTENQLFYDDMSYLKKEKSISEPLAKKYSAAKTEEQKNEYKRQLTEIDESVKQRRGDVIKNYPSTFYAKMLRAMTDVNVPAVPNGSNSDWQWRYFKVHYWDNIDLSDERLLRCPVFYNKLNTYFTKTVVQIPDSINAAGDDLIRETGIKGEIYRYVITYLLNAMANSTNPDFKYSYAYFGRNYFCNGLTPWITEEKEELICEKVFNLTK